MSNKELAAYRLAVEISVVIAKEVARNSRARGVTWHHFYDPHAATELGSLIHNRMVKA